MGIVFLEPKDLKESEDPFEKGNCMSPSHDEDLTGNEPGKVGIPVNTRSTNWTRITLFICLLILCCGLAYAFGSQILEYLFVVNLP